MTKEPLILLIEDEPDIRAFVTAELAAQGFATAEAATAELGLGLVKSLHPDAVLLDLGLPDRDGLDLLTELRHDSTLPILIVSARGREADKVLALDRGADDYLTKPFGAGELVARIKVVLRRSGALAPSAEVQLTFGPLTWDRTARRVYLDATEIHLTPIEYRLFQALALRPGRILTHRWLLEEVWGRQSTEMLHYVRIAVSGLRKKLEPEADAYPFLYTEVGVGYRFFR